MIEELGVNPDDAVLEIGCGTARNLIKVAEHYLLIVDFGGLSGWPSWVRHALYWWLARFHVTPRTNLGEEAEALAQARSFSFTCQDLHRGYARYIAIERPLEP